MPHYFFSSLLTSYISVLLLTSEFNSKKDKNFFSIKSPLSTEQIMRVQGGLIYFPCLDQYSYTMHTQVGDAYDKL